MKADSEKINLNDNSFTENIFAVTIDKHCDNKTPRNNPIPSDIKPISRVSANKILDIDFLSIPRVIYTPSSFFRLFIKKLFA